MAATFHSPPGWPQPPDGWTPPPGWSPDPSWPPAPDGWQFWSDDSAPAGSADPLSFGAASGPHVTAPTQQLPSQGGAPTSFGSGSGAGSFGSGSAPQGTSPTQQLPPQGPPPHGAPTQQMPAQGAYSYAPSTGLDQPGASPYAPGGQPAFGGPGAPTPGTAYPGPGGSGPRRGPAVIIVAVVVGALVLGGLIWGITALVGGDGGEDPTASPVTTDPTDPATSDDPTDPATDDATDPATDDPATDDPTDDGGGGEPQEGDLGPGEPALVSGYEATDPIAEIRLLSYEQDWTAGSGSMMCSEPENGQYLALELEVTTTEALSEEDPPTYNFLGWELGAEVDDIAIETSGFSGLFCLDSEQQLPSDMEPGNTYTGWALLDVPDSVTAVTYDNIFDFTGDLGPYRWVLADQ